MAPIHCSNMTTTTYQGNEGHNSAITALRADYETKVRALRNGVSDVSQGTMQRSGNFVRNNEALVITSALTIGLLVGTILGRRSRR
jgi:ElaB/YqjD/DUF883 family membrane-anchored ribosome-binding protein